MMKAETKAKWLEALRGGDYKQCKGALQDGAGGFCCLGVLHDTTGGKWHKNKYGEFSTGSKNRMNSDSDMLKGSVFLQGLDRFRAARLAELNDKGRTFKEIADIIEEQVEAK